MERKGKSLSWAVLIAYCVLLFAVWTLITLALRNFCLWQQGVPWLGEWGEALINAAVKVCVWTLPALWMIWHYRTDMAIPYLFRKEVRWKRLLLCCAALPLLNIIASLLQTGKVAVYEGFRPSQLVGTVLFVGITEETVFRGFLLNALLRKCKPTVALVISAILFVFIHYPIWYTNGLFASFWDVAGSSASIFALGLLFGWFFIEDENLLSPILLHMVWNTGVLLLFG